MNILTNFLDSSILWFYSLTDDWGIAIICIAVTLRLIMLPLSLRQKKDMHKTQLLSCEVKKIREQYKNDEKTMNQELTKIYRSNNNSLIGCFLLLLKLPVFWAVYQAIKNIPAETGSVILPWVANLSIPDPFWILPILAIIFQVLPQLLPFFSAFKNTAPRGASVGQILLISGLSMLFLTKLPAAIALYWFGSALIMSAQEVVVFLVKKT